MMYCVSSYEHASRQNVDKNKSGTAHTSESTNVKVQGAAENPDGF